MVDCTGMMIIGFVVGVVVTGIAMMIAGIKVMSSNKISYGNKEEEKE